MPVKSHPCALCNRVFQSFENLNSHVRVHTGERPFKCDVCGKRFTQNSSLELHKRTHSGLKPFKCSECAYSSSTKQNLQIHEMRHHYTDTKHFQNFRSFKGLNHLSNLNTDKKVHLKVKCFHCEICSKGFGRQGSLNAHNMIHSITERKLECEDCGKKLYQQLKNSSEGPPFPCKLCGNNFHNLYGLHAHTRQHFGQLANKCSDCIVASVANVRFPYGESLYHAGMMTDCLFCEERLPQKGLESHMRSHTRE